MAFNRVVVLVDMDCFYVQVEQRRDPSFKGKPCAVVQYKKYRGGTILAVGYEAREYGVERRFMMGDDAKTVCPDIHLFRVPESNGKANLDRYREAGAEVINVLSQFGGRVERASIDEAYIDLTDVVNKVIAQNKQHEYLSSDKLPNTHIVGWPEKVEDSTDKVAAREDGIKNWLECTITNSKNVENIRLTIAAVITEEIRAAVYHQTSFRCSAGISHNKMLSKLACGINKPNKQTILPRNSIQKLFKTMKIGKIRNLGGKLGKALMSNFEVEFMSELGDIPMDKLIELHGSKTACWLKEVCHGIDHEPVKERHVAQSIGCGKNFLGPDILNTKAKVKKWMDALLNELTERLNKDKAANNRTARTLTVHVRLETGQSLSRSGPLSKYDQIELLKQSLQLIRSLDETTSSDEHWSPGIISLSVNAKKFDPLGSSVSSRTKIAQFTDSNLAEPKTQSQSASVTKCSGNLWSSQKIANQSVFGKSPQSSNSISEYFSQLQETNSCGKDTVLALESMDKHDSVESKAKSQLPSPKKPIESFFRSRSHCHNGEDVERLLALKTKTSHRSAEGRDADPANTAEADSKKQICSDPAEQTITTSVEMPNVKSCGDEKAEIDMTNDDVIFVGAQQPADDFASGAEKSQTRKQAGLCKVDAMLLKECGDTQRKPSKFKLPDGPIFHPLYGEIDRDVFQDLPPSIQEEISRSFKITSSVIPSSQTSSLSQKSKSTNSNQRLISNFIPQSQNTPVKLQPAKPVSKEKRKSTDPSPGHAKKHKARSSTKKSPSNKAKEMAFSSKLKSDVMPLGFFRQRTQLSNAISKALTKEPPKFLQQ